MFHAEMLMAHVCRLTVVVGSALLAYAVVAARTEPQSNFIDIAAAKTTGPQRTLPVSTDGFVFDSYNQETPVNERYPHAVLFGRTCGGTIISPKWIITAAHCTLFTSGQMVLAGTNNSENDSGVLHRVKRLEVHPLFSVGPHWLDPERYKIKQVAARWDFMLAELEEPLQLNNKTIKAASLDDGPAISAGIYSAFAGYGAEHHGETMRHHMHAMQLVTLSDDKCRTLPQYNPIDMLCARGRPPRNDTACNGDSGSGLVDESGHLLGVASWVENDAFECRNGNIIVFSRVESARDWIRQVTGI